jgi:acyl-CoA reductase-like NAD-dependent aldehyde dehydrogenase
MAGAQTPLFTALLIDGELVAGQGVVEPILNPATGEVLTQSPKPAPNKSKPHPRRPPRFASWSRTTPQQRSNLLLDIANAIEKTPTCSPASNLNCGKPLHLARQDD